MTEPLEIAPEDLPGIRNSLLFYRIMAWVTGVLLVVLVLVAMPLKYIWGNPTLVMLTGIPHGWLYMVLLIAAYNIGRRVGWSLKWLLFIMVSGTVPFLSFVAEYRATKDVRARIATVASGSSAV